ncbi:hypothetical protein MRB53_013844 [Persea americana]|uniref:Uncharacterized protein n=1 Tax=Persea americana TaxID=3435 RepID=A0ACC2K9D3_PERAE|nr:hypothetical protein MRB53_013844 [Persea americana]
MLARLRSARLVHLMTTTPKTKIRWKPNGRESPMSPGWNPAELRATSEQHGVLLTEILRWLEELKELLKDEEGSTEGALEGRRWLDWEL